MNYGGIDLASRTSAFCIVDEKGERLREGLMETTAEAFATELGSVERLRIVVEASPLAEWACRTLEGVGHEVTIIDPRKAKAVIKTKKKTDRMDARKLAQMARTGWYCAVHAKSERARQWRTQLQAREGLKETRRATENRIRGLLRAHGIRLGRVSEGEFGEAVKRRLTELPRSLRSTFVGLLRMRQVVLKELKQATRRLHREAKQTPLVRRLMTVDGVGPMVALSFVATLDTPRRFRRSDQVPAYVGLVPSVQQSGDIDYRGRITKEGDVLLRTMLVEAAHVLLTRCRRRSVLKSWGLKLRKKKGLGKAKVAVARKLAMLLHRLWLREETFVPECA